MKSYSLSHLSDQTLLRDLAALVARDRATTAALLAHVAEVDARKLYLPAAYPSMFAYCVGELRLSEDAASKRIQVARAARRFPAIFAAVADGRLHLTAVGLLAPHLTEKTADGLLAAATHQSKSEVERLLAERFPRPDVLAWVEAIPPASLPQASAQHAPAHVEEPPGAGSVQARPAPGPVGDRSKVKPLGLRSFAVQFTLSQGGHDKLCYAQELLGHQIPSGDIAAVFERALDALIPQLEKGKFAATTRPRNAPPAAPGSRHVPAHVRRAVWERDRGRCTFVSDAGRRCAARRGLEFDHIEEFARGGEATVSGIRLRCRAHNQYGAGCTFGVEFMRHKRGAAAEAREAAQMRAAAGCAQAPVEDREEDADRDVIPWLRQLGFSPSEARRAAERCDGMPNTSLEERVRVALSSVRVRGTRVG